MNGSRTSLDPRILVQSRGHSKTARYECGGSTLLCGLEKMLLEVEALLLLPGFPASLPNVLV